MRATFVIVLAAALASPSSPAEAQSAIEPKLRENARYIDVTSWKFVPNGTARAKDIWHDIYLPAMREAGIPMPIVLHPDSGEWDMVILFPLPGGYSDLQYTNISPSDAKWWSLVQRKLGTEKADAVSVEMEMLIARKDRYFAHEHLDDTGK